MTDRLERFLMTFRGLTQQEIYDWVIGMTESGSTTECHLEQLFGKFETKCPRVLAKKIHQYAAEKGKERK